jgi:hypothetical protein
MAKPVYFIPRILSVLFVMLAAAFIAEGFTPAFNWGDSLMHLAITLVVVAATIVAWRWPKFGGWFWLLIGLSVWELNIRRGNVGPALIVGGLPFLTGVLFLIEGFRTKTERAGPSG